MKHVKSIILSIIFIAIIIIISILFNLNYDAKNKTIQAEQKKSNETVSINKNDDSLKDDELSLKNFLITNNEEKYISKYDSVGSGYPEGFVFLENGKFAWHHGEHYPTQENRKLSHRGTWKIEGNKLILNITEEQNAVGGEVKNDTVLGEHLSNYTEEFKNTHKTVEYIIDGIKYIINENKKVLSLNNGSMKFYEINVESNYISNLKNIAENGYPNVNNEKNKKEVSSSNFSPDDLKILGVSLNMHKTEVINLLGNDFKETEPVMTYVDVYSYTATYSNLGIKITYEYSNFNGEYTPEHVVQIELNSVNSKAMRNLSISSTKEDLLSSFNKENILNDVFGDVDEDGGSTVFADVISDKTDKDKYETITIGYEGSKAYEADEYIGKASFLLKDDKIVAIRIHLGGE